MKKEVKSKIARVRNDGRWHSRGSDWATPQELFDELDAEFHFTLDVCASDWNAKCKKYFIEPITDHNKLSTSKAFGEDGLVLDWGKNICWMNPPYGKVLNDWMKKAYESSLNGATIVCLVPSAADTAWWHDYAMKGEIRFLRGRPRFVTKEGTWQQTFSPSVIVVFDKNIQPQCDCQYPKLKAYWKTDNGIEHNKKCTSNNSKSDIGRISYTENKSIKVTP